MLAVAETGSTNADLLDLAAAGSAGEGVWLRSDRQLAGRGRLGRDWASPAGNLYASTIVTLRADDPPAPSLALVAAVALEEAVAGVLPEAARRKLAIKWPNDLLIAGAKVSGILLERAGNHVVIGIGVNVAHHPDLPDRATTSLHAEGATVDVAAFTDRLAALTAAWLTLWRTQGLATIIERWNERAHPPGTPLRVRLPEGGELAGAFDGLDAHGALRVRLDDGDSRVIHAGDIFLV
ncbi:biotin--[acetyl-CoA-carboxylase] ligase [Sphingomonas sp. RHCKR47]|uniref:biotin--[acetyl-CoA-carboxylase] ligase n=1 Tax=Sphingomonas citricola TaxID=2862498 RepID=UPI001CA542BC|nr:biotin--[acetyl-CoA-carboxylase] ligase [Sphingomonas citricola]MBW6522259.1 biotin--[acetyl-CoA-carboxylase] ligase [Sphingomonas citricola]